MTQTRNFQEIAKIMLIFGIAGPPIGGFFTWLLDIQTAGFRGILFMMVMSYSLGIVPALLTGLVAGLMRNRLRISSFVILVSASGAIFSWLVLTFALADAYEQPQFSFELESVRLTVLPGAASALVVSLFTRRKA